MKRLLTINALIIQNIFDKKHDNRNIKTGTLHTSKIIIAYNSLDAI